MKNNNNKQTNNCRKNAVLGNCNFVSVLPHVGWEAWREGIGFPYELNSEREVTHCSLSFSGSGGFHSKNGIEFCKYSFYKAIK